MDRTGQLLKVSMQECKTVCLGKQLGEPADQKREKKANKEGEG